MKAKTSNPPKGTLSGPEIYELFFRERDPLVIMPPFYNKDKLCEANSIDLRLGHEFILMRKAELASLTFKKDDFPGESENILRRFYETTYVGFTEDFVLHPGVLALGATLEYIVLPKDTMAYILGRSSWGRLGLVIATATVIHPGYRGCPTLELVNLGNIPIPLFPGGPTPVAQLTLHWVGPGQLPYRGRYSHHQWVGSTGPGYSRIHFGKEFERWIDYRNQKDSERRKIFYE